MLNLRAERHRRGWSLARVTVLTDGIGQSDLSQIERGLRSAPPGWRRRIANAFGLPEEQLFAEEQRATEAA